MLPKVGEKWICAVPGKPEFECIILDVRHSSAVYICKRGSDSYDIYYSPYDEFVKFICSCDISVLTNLATNNAQLG